ncbi:MAG: glycosyltransferase family 39 protein, partial [Chloroflexi bacterium]|nr:glycosyltransferase family 39 protein [Chloroflexota bacterium]
MNALLSLLTFALPILTGICIVHLLWADDNRASTLTLKLSLGIGLGLGLESILYFAYILFFAGKDWFLVVEVLVFAIFAFAVIKKLRASASGAAESKDSSRWISKVGRLLTPNPKKWILVIAGVIFIFASIVILNYARQRALGDWDAWMIYNRAARFLYRDQVHWQESFPQEMTVIFHADYPLLLASNIAASWSILGKETPYVPMFQSVLFAFACLGLILGALARVKSWGQAGLGLILLGGVPFYLYEGGRQTADLPLAFFMLATVVFIFLHHEEKRPILLAFAGLSAGLAAWTKNEGLLFFLVSGLALAASFIRITDFSLQFHEQARTKVRTPNQIFLAILPFLAGAILPLTVALYFKLALAPASEFLSGGAAKIMQDVVDFSRHKFIFVSFAKLFLFHGGWYRVGILPILLLYFLAFRSLIKENPPAVF